MMPSCAFPQISTLSVLRNRPLSSSKTRTCDATGCVKAPRKEPARATRRKVSPALRQVETKVKPIVSALQVSPPVTQLPWTYHFIIFSQAKPPKTRGFYMLAAIPDWWTKRELERQIQVGGACRATPLRAECRRRWHKSIRQPSTS